MARQAPEAGGVNEMQLSRPMRGTTTQPITTAGAWGRPTAAGYTAPSNMEQNEQARAREVYEVYKESHRAQNCGVDPWEHVDDTDRQAWLAVADYVSKRPLPQ